MSTAEGRHFPHSKCVLSSRDMDRKILNPTKNPLIISRLMRRLYEHIVIDYMHNTQIYLDEILRRRFHS